MATAADMTATFRLTLREDLSAAFDKLNGKLRIFRDLADRLGRGTFAGIGDNLRGADLGLAGINDRLRTTGGAAGQASSRLRGLGAAARQGAEEGIAAIDSLTARLRAIPAGDIRRAAFAATAPYSNIADRPIPLSWGGYAAGAGAALGHFHEAGEHAGGRLMGAGMTGLGLVEPVEHFREMDKEVRQTGVDLHADPAGMDKFTSEQLRRDYRLAQETWQSSRAIARSAHYLALSHLDQKTIDALQPTIAQTATAFGVEANEVTPMAFHMGESLGIKPEDMKLGLARVARAATMSHLNFRDLSAEAPGLMTVLGARGYKGQDGLDKMMNYLVLSKNNAYTVSEAATNLKQFGLHAFEKVTQRKFAAAGIDIEGAIMSAQKRGVDPIRAVLDVIRKKMAGEDPTKAMFTLSELFQNVEAGQFAAAALNDENFKKLDPNLAEIKGVDGKEIDRDFKANLTGVDPLLTKLKEHVDELSDRFGRGFVPVLRVVDHGLAGLNKTIDFFDRHLGEGVGNTLIGTIGGLLALATAIGVLGAVFPFFRTGIGLVTTVLGPFIRVLLWLPRLLIALVSPIGAVGGVVIALVAIFVAAAVAIYRHWGQFRQFFVAMWHGIRQELHGIGEFVGGIFTLDFARAARGIEAYWGGLKTFFSGLWGAVKGVFSLFLGWVDQWSGGFGSRAVAAIGAAWAPVGRVFSHGWDVAKADFLAFEGWAVDWAEKLPGKIGAALGGLGHEIGQHFAQAGQDLWSGITDHQAAAAAGAGGGVAQVGGSITVAAQPGTRIVRTASAHPAVRLQPARARGPMTGQP